MPETPTTHTSADSPDGGAQPSEATPGPDEVSPRPNGAPAPKRSTHETVRAYLLATVIIVVLDLLGRAVPFVRANLLAFVAITFLYVPSITLPMSFQVQDYGVSFDRLKRSLAWATGLAALTLVFFIPGYHLWATQARHQHLDLDAGAYNRIVDRYYGAPAAIDDGQVHIYQVNDVIQVRWQTPDAPWRLDVITDAEIVPLRGSETGMLADGVWTLDGLRSRPTALFFTTRGGSDLAVRATVDGNPIDAERFALGPAGEDPVADRPFLSSRATFEDGAAHFTLDLRWLAFAIAVQLLLIAFPEEFFYRGYLQRRTDELYQQRRYKLLGPFFVTRSIIIVSVAFAIGHFVIGWYPERLAVFFPSLAFGFLRDKTDGLVAPIVYHALCNLMVQLVSVHYIN